MASTSSDRKLRDFLLTQSPAWLAERLLNAAAADPMLLAGLQVAAATPAGCWSESRSAPFQDGDPQRT
jgi:hypothetical protein